MDVDCSKDTLGLPVLLPNPYPYHVDLGQYWGYSVPPSYLYPYPTQGVPSGGTSSPQLMQGMSNIGGGPSVEYGV